MFIGSSELKISQAQMIDIIEKWLESIISEEPCPKVISVIKDNTGLNSYVDNFLIKLEGTKEGEK